jgi:membrane protease YdiL (CAAX protease family)
MKRIPSRLGSVRADVEQPPTVAGGLAVALVAAVWVGFELLRGLYAGSGMQPAAAGLLVAMQVVMTPLALAFMLQGMLGRGWRGYGLEPRRRGRRTLLAAGAALGVLHLAWAGAAAPESAVAAARAHDPLPIGLLLAAVVVAANELVARGFLLNELARLIGGRWVLAVVFLAVALGFGHMSWGWTQVGIAIVTHLVLGLLYVGTERDLPLVIVIHMAAAVLWIQ